jgi:hypothetical protein
MLVVGDGRRTHFSIDYGAAFGDGGDCLCIAFCCELIPGSMESALVVTEKVTVLVFVGKSGTATFA